MGANQHPLRIKIPATTTTAYYELDLAGNVRRLRASGGSDLGGYRYTAFGQTKEDTASVVQPLRWKGRWHATLNGAEIYDVRARQWAPELGVFFSIDEYDYHEKRTTLWGWPHQNPPRRSDPFGRGLMKDLCATRGMSCGDIRPHPFFPGMFGTLSGCTKIFESGGGTKLYYCSYDYPDGSRCHFANGGSLAYCDKGKPPCPCGTTCPDEQ